MSRELRALRRLEQGGYRFALIDGRASFTYHGAEPVPTQWATPLLDEIKANREQLIDILQARLEWVAVYDEWTARLEADPPDSSLPFVDQLPLDEPDLAYIARLGALAIRGQMPNYEDGENDAGAAGWQRLVEAYGLSDAGPAATADASAAGPRNQGAKEVVASDDVSPRQLTLPWAS